MSAKISGYTVYHRSDSIKCQLRGFQELTINSFTGISLRNELRHIGHMTTSHRYQAHIRIRMYAHN